MVAQARQPVILITHLQENGQMYILWAEGDEEILDLVNQLTPDNITMEHISAKNTIIQKYGYDMITNGSDYNLAATIILKDRVDYQVPFYNINGDKDYQTNYKLARAYFEEVNAPYKQMFLMENMTHGLLESDSEGFSEMIHQIAEIERER